MKQHTEELILPLAHHISCLNTNITGLSSNTLFDILFFFIVLSSI